MRKILMLSAIAVLAACSPAETTDEAEAPAEVVEAPVAVTAADGGPSAGTYKITSADGKVTMEEVRADGTYTSTTEGEAPKTGTWEQKSPETYCTTEDAEGAVQKCHTETVGEDGVWTSTDPEGEVVTVERVEA
ncbi:hypothetical protein [Allopontixanthobacter sp.]|uniref:hypothetical protein n=1 Tax=Allopontixanthobacter sp. TaxID=2906452 RepID=UPI002AB85EDE|nr:hypothetical protein [Allopontixanthobacter sp.]MDZ4306627.1 hypothetical protein [Allopontixanthobacter sp.]